MQVQMQEVAGPVLQQLAKDSRVPENPDFRRFGGRKSENPDFRIPGNPDFRKLDFWNSGKPENQDFQIFRFPGFSKNRITQNVRKKVWDVELVYVKFPLKSMVIT